MMNATDREPFGIPIHVDDRVPEGQIIVVGPKGQAARLVLGPLTRWSLEHGGRWPLLSRWSAGQRERRRDRGRHEA